MISQTRRIALIDNPKSGQETKQRKKILRDLKTALEREHIHVEELLIDGPGSGSALACAAIERGCDAVIVCGGDGTINEVLQCLVGKQVALGVMPFGTANALASNLGLEGSPRHMIEALLTAQRVEVPVGRVIYCDGAGEQRSRYFTVAAGVGADALLMSRLDPGLKRRLGYALYMVEAFRIWLTHSFPLFDARFVSGGEVDKVEAISQLLAVRVRSFGGSLRNLVPGATLHGAKLSMLAFKTRSRYRYLRFLLAVLFARHTFTRFVESVAADAVECRVAEGSRMPVLIEADGEPLGALPARIEMAEQKLMLLIPANAQP